jgi:hypothetical protein
MCMCRKREPRSFLKMEVRYCCVRVTDRSIGRRGLETELRASGVCKGREKGKRARLNKGWGYIYVYMYIPVYQVRPVLQQDAEVTDTRGHEAMRPKVEKARS